MGQHHIIILDSSASLFFFFRIIPLQVRTLLGLGADPLRRNGAGESAVDCARRLGLAHLVSAMETHVRSKGYWRNMT